VFESSKNSIIMNKKRCTEFAWQLKVYSTNETNENERFYSPSTVAF
jgi:hypothetical protein